MIGAIEFVDSGRNILKGQGAALPGATLPLMFFFCTKSTCFAPPTADPFVVCSRPAVKARDRLFVLFVINWPF